MLVDLIQERDYPSMRSYFFRRTYAELEGGDGAIDQSHKIFSQTGATYNSSSHTWKWPSGAEFYFRHAQHEKNVYPYQGHAMSALAIDESTHWPEKMVRYLVTRSRSTDPNLKTRIRLGTNPGNIGHTWHMKLFLGGVCPHCEPQNAPPQGVLRYDGKWPSDGQKLAIDLGDGRIERLSISYILSNVRDHSLYPASYLAKLKMQSAATSKALLAGCWKIFEGQYFDLWDAQRGMRPGMDWDEAMKIAPGFGPMVVPRRVLNEQWWWPRWCASDYGFSISIGAAHEAVHIPPSPGWPRGRVAVVDEFGCQETAANFAKMLLERWVLDEDKKPIERRWQPWYLSPDSFSEEGHPDTLAGQMNSVLRPYGVNFSPASNDRQGGAMKLYTGLETGELIICENCKQTIEVFESRIHDPKKENDVLKISGDPIDDIYDCVRYLYYSFETHRGVTAPVQVRIQERIEKQWKTDPTAAMFHAGKIKEEEEQRGRPSSYSGGSAARRRIEAWEKSRR
jgi:hypothetical protein